MGRKRKTANAEAVTIKAPIDASAQPANFRLHLDLRLTREQGTALRKMVAGLDRDKATIPSGRVGGMNERRVVTPADAVRWLLERISDQTADMEPATPATTAPPPPTTTAAPELPTTTLPPPTMTGTTAPPPDYN